MKQPKMAYLVISSWIGVGIGAEHFYGKITFRSTSRVDTREKELKRKLSLNEAKALDKKDGCHTWRVLRETERFNSSDDIRKLAIKTYKKLFPLAEFLIEGRSSIAEPQPIIAGDDKKLMREVNRLNKMADDVGRWDNNEEMQKIWDEWNVLLGKPWR